MKLARKRKQHACGVGDALQATRVGVVLEKGAEGLVPRRADVEREHVGRRDAELAARHGEGIGVQASSEEGVAEVAAALEHVRFTGVQAHRRG